MTWFACQGARSEITFKETLSDIPVTPPDTVPEISQESIDLALTMFSIEVPDSANHPTLDMDLKDRGLTVRAAFADKADVTVGPAAFESWGLLGSTLAHELEIHCQQSFTAIYILDLFGFDGTEAAEREAYQHELYSAKRFHLSHLDQTTIADTMTFYYPLATKREQTNLKPRVARWLAKNLLAPQRNSPKIPQP
jgi:hypothetical protein